MNQRILRKLCVGVFVLLSAIGAFAKDHKPQPFSADFKVISPEGQEITTGKLYMAWPKLRLDVKDVPSGLKNSLIIDYVSQKAISLLPQNQTYLEVNLNQQSQTTTSDPSIGPTFDASNPCAGHDGWNCKEIAHQTIAGRPCDVWEIITDKMGTITSWIDAKVNFPIKSKIADGSIQEFTNIQAKQPAHTLFQIPTGYKKSEAHSKSTPGR